MQARAVAASIRGVLTRRPFGGEERHDAGVDPGALPVQRLTLDALVHEAELFVDVPGTRIELEDLQLNPVQRDSVEGVAENQPARLRAQPAVEDAPAEQADPKPARAVVLVEVT
jgi:hypothetical protein